MNKYFLLKLFLSEFVEEWKSFCSNFQISNFILSVFFNLEVS